jgi:hypothetical protein
MREEDKVKLCCEGLLAMLKFFSTQRNAENNNGAISYRRHFC